MTRSKCPSLPRSQDSSLKHVAAEPLRGEAPVLPFPKRKRAVPIDVRLALAMEGPPTRVVALSHQIAEQEFEDRERLKRGEIRQHPRKHAYAGLGNAFDASPSEELSPLEKMREFDSDCDQAYHRHAERYYIG